MYTAYKGYGFILEKEEVALWESRGIPNKGVNYHERFVFFGVFLEKVDLAQSPYLFNTPKEYTEGSQKYAQFLDDAKASLKSLVNVDEKIRLEWLNHIVGMVPRIIFFTSKEPGLWSEEP